MKKNFTGNLRAIIETMHRFISFGSKSKQSDNLRRFPIFKSLTILSFIVSTSACSNTEKWSEEVRLGNGNVITIKCETMYEGGGEEWVSNRSGTKPKENRIKFSLPNAPGKIVEWKSTKLDSSRYPEKPLLLEFESNRVTVISIVAISLGYRQYFKYVYENGVWIEEALPETFPQFPSNLFVGGGVDMPKVVDLGMKYAALNNSKIPESFKQIGPEKKYG